MKRVVKEIEAVNAAGIDWLCLVADGMTIEGQHLSAAFFEKEPTLIPDRGRRCVVQTAGSLYVLNVKNIRQIGMASIPNLDFVELVNQLTVLLNTSF